jgi:hypothetical protein
MIAMSFGADATFFSRTCFTYRTLDDLYKYAGYDPIVSMPATGTRSGIRA